MTYPQSLSATTVTALYRAAERLASKWSNACLAPDFGDRMIDAVLRHLSRLESQGQTWEPGEQAGLAVHLLAQFWAKNARRDFARKSGAPVLVELCESIPDSTPTESSLDMDSVITAIGEVPELAWAYVLRRAGLGWAEVAERASLVTGKYCSCSQVRQWARRHFSRIDERVRLGAGGAL